MFPIGDDNPTRRTPVVNTLLIVANIVVFVVQLLQGTEFILRWAFIPARLTAVLDGIGGPEVLATIFTAMFMHASIGHIVGNLLFLYIFGDNVEDNFGHIPYLFFYLLCGVAATFAQYFTDPISTIPNLGASGAISGVLGAYIVLYPTVRVRLFIWPFSLFLGSLGLPAFLWIGFWFGMQLLPAVQTLGRMMNEGGVAFWAHVGGFVAGVLLVLVFRRRPRSFARTV
jgi:membrane associated rhomboid family serine protease